MTEHLTNGSTRFRAIQLPPGSTSITIDPSALEQGKVWVKNSTDNRYMSVDLYVIINNRYWYVSGTALLANQLDSIDVDSEYSTYSDYRWELRVNGQSYPVTIIKRA